ncbi:MAG TPA: hypothetical protein VJ724_12125 [Tahibacter sp.]|nr:hypothetical protein [Tahibacter sp.]
MRRWALLLCGFCLTATAAPPVLRIEAQTTVQDTGTMRYVDRLSLRYGVAELVLASNEADGVLRPVPGPQYPIGNEHVLLFGWSSWGGGMTTLHAMLFLADGDRLALVSALTLTGERAGTAFVARRDGAARVLIGIAEPSAVVHEPREWALTIGAGNALDIDAIRQLPFVDTRHRADDALYAPNRLRRSNDDPASPARVAWISSTPQGFTIEEPPH